MHHDWTIPAGTDTPIATPTRVTGVPATAVPVSAVPAPAVPVTAAMFAERLSLKDITAIGPTLRPLLADAANELASIAGMTTRCSDADSAAVLVRTIARATLSEPAATGQAMARAFEHLA